MKNMMFPLRFAGLRFMVGNYHPLRIKSLHQKHLSNGYLGDKPCLILHKSVLLLPTDYAAVAHNLRYCSQQATFF